MPKRTPLTSQSHLPKAPRMRGSSRPRKRSSSPSTVLKIIMVTITANHSQFPEKNSWPATDCRNRPWSRSTGAGIFGSSSLAATRRMQGTRIHQSRPPRRPVRGLRGARSQSASLSTDQRSVPCSRRTAIITKTNCQIMPTVRHNRMARGHALGPSSVECSRGATIQASAAMGSAAAAQVPRMRRREYCGSGFGSVPTGTVPGRFAALRECGMQSWRFPCDGGSVGRG